MNECRDKKKSITDFSLNQTFISVEKREKNKNSGEISFNKTTINLFAILIFFYFEFSSIDVFNMERNFCLIKFLYERLFDSFYSAEFFSRF